MATQYVPDDIRDFILKHIASVAQIEALLLIWATPGKRWGITQIAARIYASQSEAAKALEGLCGNGLLDRKDGAFGLNTSEEIVEMIGRLREAYARHLIPVTDIIHSRSRSSHVTAEASRPQRDR
jgi:DNA-binding MarR family transcriptional regulator